MAQDNGIRWTTGLDWESIKAKAKVENKFIFLDVYATWCAPCKAMDKNIYPLAEVGKLYNDKFLSVRVQADESPKDDENVRSWYQTSKQICKEYSVGVFPTYLFLTSDGRIIHRASGGFNKDKFLSLATDALEQKGYAFLVEKFKSGYHENLNLKELAINAKHAGDDSLAKTIIVNWIKEIDIQKLILQENMLFLSEFTGQDKRWIQDVCMPKLKAISIDQLANPLAIRFILYVMKNDSLVSHLTNQWISTLNSDQIYLKENLWYFRTFMLHSVDKSFKILYENSNRIDEIMGEKNWAQSHLENIIIKDEFYGHEYKDAIKRISNNEKPSVIPEPNWKKLKETILNKYDAGYARRLQYRPRISWYKLMGDKRQYVKSIVAEMKRTNGWDLNGLVLNNYAMEVFRYSKSRKELINTAMYMRKYFRRKPEESTSDVAGIDTYAILLYKAGRAKDGISWEEKAAMIAPNDIEIASNLKKMKNGAPIWPEGFNVEY
jgi:thiol-disulfide isomerase/thioredoxin